MKLRKGFVSNSSSSSFIIATGIVKDGEAFKKQYEETGAYAWDIEVHKVKDLKEKGKTFSEVVSFDGNQVSIYLKNREDEEYIVEYYYTGNEGDYPFSVYDGSGEWVDINYDRWDYNDFPEDVQSVINLMQKECSEMQMIWGAGRNG